MFESILGLLIFVIIGLMFSIVVKQRTKDLTELEEKQYETARKEATR